MASAQHVVVWLDYDGTLVPLKPHPSQARLPDRVRRLLQRLVHREDITVALISGRSLRDLKSLVGLRGVCYVGNHGLELEGLGLRYVHPEARRSRTLLHRMAKRLKDRLKPIPGAWVEDKGLTLSLHVRQVPPRHRRLAQWRLRQMIDQEVKRGGVRLVRGKAAFEVRPSIDWDKGKMIRWFLRKRFSNDVADRALVMYIGDDRTDEDAFQALRSQGVTIVVTRSPRKSLAHLWLRSPQEVQRFLRQVVAIRSSP